MITSVSYVPNGSLQPKPLGAKVSEQDLQKVDEEMLRELQRSEEAHTETTTVTNDSAANDEEMEEVCSEDEADVEAKALQAATSVGGAREGLPAVAPGMKLIGKEAENEEQMEKMLAELDLENYETDSDEENVLERAVGPSALRSGLLHVGDDPYLQEGSDESDSEDEDWEYQPEDIVLVATKSKDDMGTLEVWVYEEADDTSGGNLFVHHDIVLPSFPLSLALMDVLPGKGEQNKKVCTVAIGSMTPAIEIWDLDVADAVEPLASLQDESSKSKKGEKQNATVSLSWNAQYRNVLASGGSDKRIRIWDVATEKRKHKFKIHSKEVQCVAWNPVEASVLGTASFDKTCCLMDVRTPDGDPLSWSLSGEAEGLVWSPTSATSFLVSSDDGMIASFDARKGSGSDALFRLAAHEKPTTVISFCPTSPTLFMSASIDKKVKMWSLKESIPSLIVEKNVGAGSIFSGGFCGVPAAHLIYVGGDNGDVVVWDTRASQKVVKHLGQPNHIPQVFNKVREITTSGFLHAHV